MFRFAYAIVDDDDDDDYEPVQGANENFGKTLKTLITTVYRTAGFICEVLISAKFARC